MLRLLRVDNARRALIVLIAVLLLIGPGTVYGSQEPQQLVVKVGESYILPTTALERVAVADPAVADVVVASPSEVIINGKASGVTSLHVWDRDGRRSFMVKVNPIESDAARQVSEMISLPGVTAKSVKGAVVLEGRVPDKKSYDRAEKIAKAVSDRVVNLLTIENEGVAVASAPGLDAAARAQQEAARAQQEAARAERDAATKAEKEAAIKAEEKRHQEELAAARKALPERVKTAVGLPNVKIYLEGESLILDGTAPTQTDIDRATKIAQAMSAGLVKDVVVVIGMLPLEVPQVLMQVQVVEVYRETLDHLGITWGTFEDANSGLVPGSFMIGQLNIDDQITQVIPISGRVEALTKSGKAKLLAAPSLLTVSGKSAQFLAGGEIPVPIPTRDGIVIYWKEYGVKLEMLPDVRSDQLIYVHLKPEVSTLDWANAAKVNSGIMPAIKARRAETDVRLVDGETVIIGGLLSNEEAKNTQGLPLLAKLPIIGKLFGSDSFKKGQTELVFFVTPRVVRRSGDVTRDMVTNPKDLSEPLQGVQPPAKSAPASAGSTDSKGK